MNQFLPDRGRAFETTSWRWALGGGAPCEVAACTPPSGETPPQRDPRPSASSEPEAASPRPCSPADTQASGKETSLPVCTFSPSRGPHVIQAQLVDGNQENVGEATQSLGPQELHKRSHLLRHAGCVQPLLQQQLLISRQMKRRSNRKHAEQRRLHQLWKLRSVAWICLLRLFTFLFVETSEGGFVLWLESSADSNLRFYPTHYYLFNGPFAALSFFFLRFLNLQSKIQCPGNIPEVSGKIRCA